MSAGEDGVLIVGGGPVGLIAALGLAQRGIPVTVLEGEPEIPDSPRAIVYHWTVLEGLDRLGMLDEAAALGFRKQDYAARVFETGEMVPWSLDVLADETPYPYNVHLGQHLLAGIALRRLEDLAHARVHFDHRVSALAHDGSGVTVTAAGGTFRARWLIGADGARSTIRTALGLAFDGTTWPERFVATNVRYDFEAHGYPRTVMQLDPEQGAIIAKISNEPLWRVTYSEDAALGLETVADRVPGRFAALLPGEEGYSLERCTPYRMHQRAAETFRVGRVLLAGDAAHATNPTGGLGLTSGLFDAYALIDALGAVLLDGADEQVLDHWAAERRRIFLDIASPAASENKRLVYAEHDPQRRREDIAAIRRWAGDRELLRTRLHFTEQMIGGSPG
jgi:3-(3-hydroxy-phenyl)propionate hydroxylase